TLPYARKEKDPAEWRASLVRRLGAEEEIRNFFGSPPASTIQLGRLPRPVHVWLGSFGLRYSAAALLPLRPPNSSATVKPDFLASSSIAARASCRSLTRFSWMAASILP